MGTILFHHGHGHRRGQDPGGPHPVAGASPPEVSAAPGTNRCRRAAPTPPEGLRNLDALLLQQAATAALPYEQVIPMPSSRPSPPYRRPGAGASIPFAGLSAGLREIEGAGADLAITEGGGLVPAAGSPSVCSEWVALGAAAGDPGGGGQAGLRSTMPCSPSAPFASRG